MRQDKPPYTDENGRVPLVGAAGRNHILQEYSIWVYHHAAPGVTFDGLPPSNTSAVVTAGCSVYKDLIQGGLFSLPGSLKRPVEVSLVDNAAGSTITIIDAAAGTERPIPTAFPFTLAPAEVLKAIGGAAGSRVGFLMREELPWR